MHARCKWLPRQTTIPHAEHPIPSCHLQVTVLLLATILASHNTVRATQLHNSRHLTVDSKCSAESQCVNEPGGCSDAYAYSTSSFPYTLRYTTTGSITDTTFVFQVSG